MFLFGTHRTVQSFLWRFLCFGFFSFIFFGSNIVFASFGIRLDGDRSSIAHFVSAGGVVNDEIIIHNPDDTEKIMSVFGVDQVRSLDGTYVPQGQYRNDSLFAAWMGSPVTFSVPAQTVYKYPFKITVPSSISSGVYHGAIMIREESKNNTEGMIKITTQAGIRIVLTVSGGRLKVPEESIPPEIARHPSPAPIVPLEKPDSESFANSKIVENVTDITLPREAPPSPKSSSPQVASRLESDVPVVQVPEKHVGGVLQEKILSVSVEKPSGLNTLQIFVFIVSIILLFWMAIRFR